MDLLLVNLTKVVPLTILADGKCSYFAATMYFIHNKSLVFELRTVSELLKNILVYSSYAGPKYWKVKLEVVSGLKH